MVARLLRNRNKPVSPACYCFDVAGSDGRVAQAPAKSMYALLGPGPESTKGSLRCNAGEFPLFSGLLAMTLALCKKLIFCSSGKLGSSAPPGFANIAKH